MRRSTAIWILTAVVLLGLVLSSLGNNHDLGPPWAQVLIAIAYGALLLFAVLDVTNPYPERQTVRQRLLARADETFRSDERDPT